MWCCSRVARGEREEGRKGKESGEGAVEREASWMHIGAALLPGTGD